METEVKKVKINNNEDLNNEMVKVMEQLRNKEIGMEEARANSSVAKTIVSIQKTQMDYNKMTGRKDNTIKFMELLIDN